VGYSQELDDYGRQGWDTVVGRILRILERYRLSSERTRILRSLSEDIRDRRSYTDKQEGFVSRVEAQCSEEQGPLTPRVSRQEDRLSHVPPGRRREYERRSFSIIHRVYGAKRMCEEDRQQLADDIGHMARDFPDIPGVSEAMSGWEDVLVNLVPKLLDSDQPGTYGHA